MTDYISEYTGEEIDAGIAKANMVYNALPKVSDEGDSLTLDGTANCPMKMELKGNTEQNGTPTPDYPQPVRVVTGNNSVKVEGKNLYDEDSESTDKLINSSGIEITNSGFNTSDYILIKGNISYNLSWESASSYFQAFISYYDSNKTFIQRENITTSNTYTKAFTTLENAKYIRISYSKEVNETPAPRTNKQLEKGSTATTYEPYQSQTYPINLGTIELCKIGSYQDYIYKDNGKWYKHSEIGKVVLDGSENWRFQGINDYGIANYSTDAVQSTLTANSFYAYCSHFEKQTSPISTTTTQGFFYAAIGYFYIRILPEIINVSSEDSSNVKIQKIKTWLSTHNVEVYYVLETPTNTEITDTTLISQLNALENAVSYDTQTNIVQENYSEPFIINAECVRSLKDIFELISNS